MKLYIGNKNYSSWSLRPWLVLNKFTVPYEEIKLALFSSEFYEALEGISDTNKVPTLVDGGLTIHESLAIAEYINEVYCNGQAWPKDRTQRAKARALSAEMASSFSALRTALPMNIRASRTVQLQFFSLLPNQVAAGYLTLGLLLMLCLRLLYFALRHTILLSVHRRSSIATRC